MSRKLAAYERQNQLDLALEEIGKVERTLFILDWLENATCGGDVRPTSTTANNSMHFRHASATRRCVTSVTALASKLRASSSIRMLGNRVITALSASIISSRTSVMPRQS